MNLDADVIIVGAGPGGVSAAYFLGEAGFRVLVMEKCELPRYKTCAGGVPTSALEFFPFDFEPVIEQHINRASFVYKQKQVTQTVPNDSLVMVMREDFDYYILSQSNAEVLPEVEVQQVMGKDFGYEVQTRDGRTFCSTYVLGADGPNSRVARSVGLKKNRSMGIALEVEAKVSPDILESFQGRFLVGLGDLNEGYYWIFPKSGHLSVGLGTMHKGSDRDLLTKFTRIMENFDIQIDKSEYKAHPMPVYSCTTEVVQDHGVLLLGDAAGIVDPLTGEGIRHAIVSGYLAADCISNNRVHWYTELVNRQIANDLYYAQRVSDFFYKYQKLSFECLVRNKLVFQDLVRIISHRMKYRKGMLKFPWYLFNFWQRIALD